MLTVKDVGYKGAVAESLNEKLAEEGVFDALLQTPTGNHFFSLTLDEDANWKTSIHNVDRELIDQIGDALEKITA